jgi:ATP-binding cassette subfamily B protein
MFGLARMYEILDAPDTMTEAAAPADGPVETGDIVFENVHFGYGDAPELIPGLDFTFEAGRTTALVGPSGGGKSTLLSLVMRLYDPDEGRVLLAGRDLRDLPLAGLRARMAYVGQNTFLFDGTVRDNIRVGRRDATDAEIEDAARAAQAHDFVQELPQGYDSPIGENGTLLSGGQRQRLAIARAFLRDAPILLLDEATSALDSISEAQIRDAIQRLSAGRTTIVIAHRLSTILKADRICYVEKGRIVEHGSLPTLLANEGPFRRLFDEQFRYLPT